MDSLNAHNATTVATNLREWLKHEYAKKMTANIRGASKRHRVDGGGDKNKSGAVVGQPISTVGSTDVAVLVEQFFGEVGQKQGGGGLALLRPKVPMQNNAWDCGVFALQYAEEVVRRSPDIFPEDLRGNTVAGFDRDMFGVQDIIVKRRNMKNLVNALIAVFPAPTLASISETGKRKRK
mmetsp:Transcript_59743/g.102893  ORF Transcript_59743/g.102893 Transcript_59743/m.102893 type:complete len:179 (-) Transcript_59743:113-649(-)